MLPRANAVKRKPCSAAHITNGLQCGGSDGYSGISANPALGAAVDLLVAHGGTAILSETPEIYGAEHLGDRLFKRPFFSQNTPRNTPRRALGHAPAWLLGAAPAR